MAPALSPQPAMLLSTEFLSFALWFYRSWKTSSFVFAARLPVQEGLGSDSWGSRVRLVIHMRAVLGLPGIFSKYIQLCPLLGTFTLILIPAPLKTTPRKRAGLPF